MSSRGNPLFVSMRLLVAAEAKQEQRNARRWARELGGFVQHHEPSERIVAARARNTAAAEARFARWRANGWPW